MDRSFPARGLALARTVRNPASASKRVGPKTEILVLISQLPAYRAVTASDLGGLAILHLRRASA